MVLRGSGELTKALAPRCARLCSSGHATYLIRATNACPALSRLEHSRPGCLHQFPVETGERQTFPQHQIEIGGVIDRQP
jgi:hypothetical protein